MEAMRKPFQGVLNIIRFNWHFYVIALIVVFLLLIIANQLSNSFQTLLYIIASLILISTSISLLASFYIYDLSGLYNLTWITKNGSEKIIVNINAGFDETSVLLKSKFETAELLALDFYDPKKHTEVSIKRARKAYPEFPKTKQIKTSDLKLDKNSIDKIFVIFSAHEIRNDIEKLTFFKELNRVIKPSGEIYIMEHLRNLPNFLVYTFGFFHFYPKHSWLKIFEKANFTIQEELKLNPFISTFILRKNGNTL